MRASSCCFTFTTTTFFILCLIRQSSSQIVGCDGNNVDCPSANAKDSGACSHEGVQDGIGIVSFESNITSDGPLTWTLLEWDEPKTSHDNPFTTRGSYLGSPASLNFRDVTDFGACAISLASNITSALQLPSSFNDFANFGCDTVMGQSCAQDLVSQVRDELMGLLNDTSYDGSDACLRVGERLQNTPLPASCVEPLNADLFQYGDVKTLTNDTENLPSMCQTQDGCSLTTGGSSYNMVWGPDEIFSGKANSEEVEVYKNGTSALLTLFYSEPRSNVSTGSVDFLREPEVHLSCLRKMPTEEQQSGSIRLRASLGDLGATWILVGGLLWTFVVI